MSTTTPFISVVIPTYNVEKYIDRCLTSCANQSLSNIELIVVDDCGSDRSLDRADAWAKKDERILIIKNPKNLGTYHARRVGVEHSRAEFIVFLDPDDELSPNAAEVIYQAAKKHHPELIFFTYENIPRNIFWPAKQNLPPALVQGEELPQEVLVANLSLGTPGKAYSREALLLAYRKLSISNTKRMTYAEDALLLYAVIADATKAISIDLPLYRYYKNPQSAMNKKDQQSLNHNASQIDEVICSLKQYSPRPSSEARKLTANVARQTFIKKLLLDKTFILRHTCNTEGQSQYLPSLLKIIFHFRKWKESIRLIAFLGSFGLIRL